MKYRKMKRGEKVRKGDEVRIDGEWVKSANWLLGIPKGSQSSGCEYRRPIFTPGPLVNRMKSGRV